MRDGRGSMMGLPGLSLACAGRGKPAARLGRPFLVLSTMSDSTPPQRTEVLYMVANGSACEVPTPMQGVLPHLSSSGPGSGPGQSPRRLPGPRIGALRACPGMTVEGTARLTRMTHRVG